MTNMIFLLGYSGSGKDTVLHHIIDIDPSFFKPIIQYTTRPKRPGEMDGVEYHFVSNKQCNDDLRNDLIAQYECYYPVNGDEWVYYTKKEDIKVRDDICYIIQGPLKMYKKYKNIFTGIIKPVFLYASTNTLVKRCIQRMECGPIEENDILEIFRRIDSDKHSMPLQCIQQDKIPVVVNEATSLKETTENVLSLCGYEKYADISKSNHKDKSIVDAISDILCLIESGARDEHDDSVADLMPMARYLIKHLNGDKILKMFEYYNKQQNKNN